MLRLRRSAADEKYYRGSNDVAVNASRDRRQDPGNDYNAA